MLTLLLHLLHAPCLLVSLVLLAELFVAQVLTIELGAARKVPALARMLIGQDFTRAFHLFFNLLNSKRFLMKLATFALGIFSVLGKVPSADRETPVSKHLSQVDVLLVNFHENKNEETSHLIMEKVESHYQENSFEFAPKLGFLNANFEEYPY